MPSISVVLPVYNGSSHLGRAIDSILIQNFRDFELNIVNDGSSDDSEEIIKNISDARINYVNQSNQGLAATLNNAIRLSKGNFIARLDQDDLMLQSRLAKQMEYLELNPDCAMVGTWSEILAGVTSVNRWHKHPSSYEALQLELLFDNPFVHSSVMMRVDVLRELGGYSEDKLRQPPEDYELWSRIARKYQVANIPEVLTVYREVEGSMSRVSDNPFLKNVIKISAENIATILSPKFSAEECYLLASAYHGSRPDNKNNTLTRSCALLMHKEAAVSIGGESSKWSEEFSASYDRQRLQIRSQFTKRFLPSSLLKPMRIVRNFITQSVSRILGDH